MSQETAKQVKLAKALVENLDIYDGAGYDLMPSFALDFLNSVADTGTVDAHIENYLSEIQSLHDSLNWIRDDAKKVSVFWNMRIETYITVRTSNNRYSVEGAIDNILAFRADRIVPMQKA